jgi:hypothetical protein
MKRSINFSSIFRRKDDQLPSPADDQTDNAALAERLRERSIKLERGDLEPVSSASPPLDWDAVDGHITVPAAAVEGMLQGRARIRAADIKSLSPSPLAPDTPDQSEYIVALATLIPQIQDLLGTGKPELVPEAEYETPFTILAKQDGARFAEQNDGEKKLESRERSPSDVLPLSPDAVGPSKGSLSAQELQPEEKKEKEQEPGAVNAEPPVLTLRTLRHAPPHPGVQTKPPEAPLDGERNRIHRQEMKNKAPKLPDRENIARIERFESQEKAEETVLGESAVTPLDSRRWDVDASPAGRGMGLLQEIFMTSEPLDGRRVASLVRQFPGVTGALILLQGGAVLGGQLPESLNMDAALQAPEVLAKFLRFILELEGASAAPRFVTVTSTNTTSLVSCGQVVLLVSHQGRKLPPGLAQRLTETAQALDLVYGKY